MLLTPSSLRRADAGARDTGIDRRLLWVATACAVLPIVVAVIRAIAGEWLPTGDSAYFVVRSRDVLTEHHPLVGAWSSGSLSIDTSVNNLGPLQLDLLAPFTKIAPRVGTALAVGLTHSVSILGIAATVRRLSGEVTAIVAMVMCAWLGWLMGSGALLEARQHPFLMFVLLWFLCLVWAVAAGRAWALPWAAFVGSLIVQTQFAFGLIAGLMAGFATVAFVAAKRRGDARKHGDHQGESDDNDDGSVRRPVIASLVVLGVVWIQPGIDQFVGDGNLGRVLSAPGSGSEPGYGETLQVVASLLTNPANWVRPAFQDFRPNFDLTAAPLSIIGMVALAVVVAVTWQRARRRGDRTVTAGAMTAAALTVGSLVMVKSQPVSVFGLTLDNVRWLWACAAFIVIVVGGSMATGFIGWARHRTTDDGRARLTVRPTAVTASAAAMALVLALANLPHSTGHGAWGYHFPPYARVRDFIAQIDGDELPDVVRYDGSRAYFGELYSYTVLVRLQELGVEFTFREQSGGPSPNVARFGETRRDTGQAQHQLSLVTGPLARAAKPDARRIAHVSALDRSELAELDALHATVVSAIGDGLVEPADAATADDAVTAYIATVNDARDDDASPPPTLLSNALWTLRRQDAVTIDPSVSEPVDRFIELAERERLHTVALFLGPVSTGS